VSHLKRICILKLNQQTPKVQFPWKSVLCVSMSPWKKQRMPELSHQIPDLICEDLAYVKYVLRSPSFDTSILRLIKIPTMRVILYCIHIYIWLGVNIITTNIMYILSHVIALPNKSGHIKYLKPNLLVGMLACLLTHLINVAAGVT
jgi:hypothetical protein